MADVGAWVVSTTSLTCTEYLAVKPKLPSKVGQWHGTCTGTPYQAGPPKPHGTKHGPNSPSRLDRATKTLDAGSDLANRR